MTALSSEDVRRLLYEIGADALLARLAIDTVETCDEDETLVAVRRLLNRIKSRAEDVAGGHTFDRLNMLERGVMKTPSEWAGGKAVAS